MTILIKDAHILRLDAPGMGQKDIKVQVTDDNVITISGERSRQNEEKTDKFYRMERSYGRFCRSFPLPQDADNTRINARVDRGVVEVTIPKKSETMMKPRVTDIPLKG